MSNVGIGISNPAFPLSLGSSTGQKLALFQNAAGGDFYGLGIAPGAMTVWASGAERMRINNFGQVGIGTATPGYTLDVAGDFRARAAEITTYMVVGAGSSLPTVFTVVGGARVGGTLTMWEAVICGGCDIAEPFNVNEGTEARRHEGTKGIKPGMVVCIDAANPGELRLSTRAYDRTVAGIISGAGGVKPGMTLRQEGSPGAPLADGEHPVALTGRVYCWVDADAGGPVRPGDLLTTSDTPGHAMKATDLATAQGAIIGKAMTGLKNGKRLVLVLVSLN